MSSSGRALIALVAIAASGLLAFAPDDGVEPASWTGTPVPWLDTGDRAQVVAAYNAEFEARPPDLDWVGDQESCEPGASTPAYREATLRRVNYYRAMAGVPATVIEDESFSEKAQQAAMMMSAEGILTHSPPSSFACYSEPGREAAANSNLYLGRTGPTAVDGYVEDPGAHNIDVGHRTTILHPPTQRMGVGDVGPTLFGSAANALWVFDERVFDEESVALRPEVRESDRFVAWPPRGHVPADLVHPRWSFTLVGADFSEATISLYRLSGPSGPMAIPVEVIDRSGETGHVPLPTIVWEPQLSVRGVDLPVDERFLVVVHGVGLSTTDVADDAAVADHADHADHADPQHVEETVDGTTETVDGTAEPAEPIETAPHDGVSDDPVAGTTTSFAYEVRVLGAEASPELTVEGFLARLGK